MGFADFATAPLFGGMTPPPPVNALSPAEQRAAALQGSPSERGEFTRTVPINVDGYRLANEFIDNLIASSERSKYPGGLWLLGDGGLGKSFILEAAYRRYPPYENHLKRYCPVLTLTFKSKPSESDILVSLLLQLGQSPDILSYEKNSDLEAIVKDAMKACGVLAIFFDEAHHLWMNTSAKQAVDRTGGVLGGFLKTFYNDSGVACIFAGTPGLQDIYDRDPQIHTRWPGIWHLTPFANDEKFRGLLAALDQALPMPEPAGLADEPLASELFISSKGNLRLLKNVLAAAVFIAATENAPKLTWKHLQRAHFLTFCTEATPFDQP